MGLIWYEKVLRTPEFLAAFVHSIAIGVLAAGIATGLALCLALGFRREFSLKTAIFNLVRTPIIMPGIVGGIVLLLFFGYLGFRPSLWTTVLVAHVNWVLPFAFLVLYPRLHNFDRSLEEAAMDLGAPVIRCVLARGFSDHPTRNNCDIPLLRSVSPLMNSSGLCS